MPVYTTRPGADSYGHCLGLLMLDVRQPFVPGDVGNASSYRYPVLFQTVPGAFPDRVLFADPDLEDAACEAARTLETQGVRALGSDCGFFINYQDAVREAVDIPVVLSSLLQLPLISSFIARDRPLGVLTASTKALGNQVIARSGIEPGRHLVVRGMQDEAEWYRAFRDPAEHIDTDQIEELVVAKALEIVEEAPDVGAFLLECSLMPPYAEAVQRATGRPVYDFMTLLDLAKHATHQPRYEGHY